MIDTKFQGNTPLQGVTIQFEGALEQAHAWIVEQKAAGVVADFRLLYRGHPCHAGTCYGAGVRHLYDGKNLVSVPAMSKLYKPAP